MHHSEINTFHNVCKSKISFTELYEFIRIFMSACLTLFIYNCLYTWSKLKLTKRGCFSVFQKK